MKINYVFLQPLHPYAYIRPNCDIPLITGLVHVETDNNKNGNVCYEVTYEDGFKDYVPITDVTDGSYRLVVQ